MSRITAVAWVILVVAAFGAMLPSTAPADGNQMRPTLASNFVMVTNQDGGLRMIPAVTNAAITERPGDRQKERLRRMKMYQTLGVAGAVAVAAVVGGALAGPAYGTAAGAAVLISYLITQ